MIDTKNEAEEYFAHNPKSEGVVFIMIDKSDLINPKRNIRNFLHNDYKIEDNCDFSIVELVHNNKEKEGN